MSSDYLRKRKQRLFEKDPHCHWCHCEVVMPVKGGKCVDNTATIDHLKSRYSVNFILKKLFGIKRPSLYGKERTLVLACWKCNNEREIEETKQKSKISLWLRARSFPRWLGFLNKILGSNQRS